MENLWWLYLIEVLPNISIYLFIISIFGILFFTILVCAGLAEGSKYVKHCVFGLVIFIFIGFISILIPSRNGLYTIIAGVSITEIAKTEAAKRMSDKTLKIIENWLDQNLPTPIKK